MQDHEFEDLFAVAPALLQALEALAFAERYLHPTHLDELIAALDGGDDALRRAQPRLAGWPESLAGLQARLEEASKAALSAFDALRAAEPGDALAAHEALRPLPSAYEALYPLAAVLEPVNRFFLSPEARGDAELLARLAQAPQNPLTGIFHVDSEPGQRGGVSLYVPETYAPERPCPLIVALHGGSGHGRSFLWTWLRDARTRGAILICPTSAEGAWSLAEPDLDGPRLAHLVERARTQWNIDPARLLLTGMSDGGTKTYLSGLEADSPFTHLAPVAAAFHPTLAQAAAPERLRGLPIYIVHGAVDWVFPAEMAREAAVTLTAAGARVTHREIADLSHAYPAELNPAIMDWLAE